MRNTAGPFVSATMEKEVDEPVRLLLSCEAPRGQL